MRNEILRFTVERKKGRVWNATAYNERFHASGGMCSGTMKSEIER